MTIRRARPQDAAKINDLLCQVAQIHAAGRPDIFKPATKKYSDEQLLQLIACDETPIFVAVDEGETVLGYAFCICQAVKDSLLLQDKRTLYIDDLCVDEAARGTHIGKALYAHVLAFAKEQDFDNLTLNVWAFNEPARRFYEHLGMTPQKIIMEQIL